MASISWGQGRERVLAVPGMLFAAGHAKNDIPSVLNTYAAERRHHASTMAASSASTRRCCAPPATAFSEALARRAEADVRGTKRCWWSSGAAPPIPTPIPTSPRSRACCGKAWASAGPRPPIPASPSRWSSPALEHAAKLGYRRIVVFPYFLFTGVLVSASTRHADRVRRRPSRHRVHQGALSQRPPAGHRHLRRPRQRDPRRRHRHELPACANTARRCWASKPRWAPQESHHHHVEGIGSQAAACATAPAPAPASMTAEPSARPSSPP